jgi:acyl carrier protein
MSRQIDLPDFYTKLDEVLDAPAGSVQGGKHLAECGTWDSVAVLSFIAMVDRDYGVILPTEALAECETVDALVALVSSA